MTGKTGWKNLSQEAFAERVHQNRIKRMSNIDNSSPDMRGLYNDYGGNVVNNFLSLGITQPKHIRHLVECVLDEFSPTRGSHSRQGIRTEVAR